MAFDKKSSMHSEHGNITSAEELDAYGVWVKSEPQDFTAGLADAANFDAEAIPYEADYEADFDAGFGDLGVEDIGLPDFEPEIPEVEVSEVDSEDNAQDDFDDGIIPGTGQNNEEASTQLLMKIANELSMIRSELSTLKKEFAGIRVESAPDAKPEAAHGGFFTEEEDEKIALTGDEMEDIFSSADFSGEEELGYDPLREADEAALKELSEQNESFVSESEMEEESPEEINIDFNNLGINLDNELEEETAAEAREELPPLEGADDDFETPSFDTLSFDETPELETETLETEALEEADQGFAEELVPLEEDAELRDIRLEGAIPLTPPPDNSTYLEEDPFALDHTSHEAHSLEVPSLEEPSLEEPSLEEDPFAFDDTGLEVPSLEETSLEEPSLEETVIEEEPVPEETVEEVVPEEPVLEEAVSAEAPSADAVSGEDTPDLSFDDVSFDLDFDDFSDDSSLSFEDEGDDKAAAAAPAESPAPLADEPSESPEEKSSDALDVSLDLSDDLESSESLAPLEAEPSAEESSDAFDVSLDLSDIESSESLAPPADEPPAEEPPAEKSSDALDVSLDLSDLESSESLAPLEDEPPAEEPSAEEPPAEEPPADESSEEDVFDAVSLDLSEAVIDEPDLSAEIVEPPLEEPVLGDISFKDDISLEMDDFGTPDTVKADEKADSAADIDDSLAQVIPEGFEVNAEEAAVSFDDDLEAFTDDDLSIAAGEVSPLDASASEGAGGEDTGISSGLKSELKSVLSYMDHLLESLPEEKIEEFAKSEHFNTYKKIFKELGLV